MKRFLSILLISVMITSLFVVSASAASFSVGSTSKGSGDVLDGGYGYSSTTKASNTGSAASCTGVTCSNAKATFAFRARVDNASQQRASNMGTVTNKGDCVMTTLKDGNGQSLLRKGYNYFLAYTHSSNSGVTSASCSGTWKP